MSITLESLVGEHELTGVSFDVIKPVAGSYDEDANSCTFILDGKAYQAVEDPSDGYRSSMRDILECDPDAVSNVFAPIPVLGSMREGDAANDIIDFADVRNGKRILSIGTSNTDDYYPSFEYNWAPENIARLRERVAWVRKEAGDGTNA